MNRLLSGRALIIAWCSWLVVLATTVWRVYFVQGLLVGMPRQDGVPVDRSLVALVLIVVALLPMLLLSLVWFVARRVRGRHSSAAF